MVERLGGEKLIPEMDEKVRETIREVADETEAEIEIKETPDTLSLKVKNKGGDEYEMGFMKMGGGEIPVRGKWKPLEEVVEARLRFPKDDIPNAVEKLERLKESRRD